MKKSPTKSSAGLGLSFAHNMCAEILNAQEKGLLTSKQDKQYGLQAALLMKAFEQHEQTTCSNLIIDNQSDKRFSIINPIVRVCVEKKLKPYVATIPTVFYKELFRLHGLNFDSDTILRPIHFGILVNDLIFKRLPPETLDPLKTKSRKVNLCKTKKNKNDALQVAYGQLHQHIGETIAMMKLSNTFDAFKEKINRLSPLCTDILPFTFESDSDLKDGVVL